MRTKKSGTKGITLHTIDWNSRWIRTTAGWRSPEDISELPVFSLSTGSPWQNFAVLFALVGMARHRIPKNFLANPEAFEGTEVPVYNLQLNCYDKIFAPCRGGEETFALCPRCLISHAYALVLFTATGGRGYRSGLLQNTTTYLILQDTIGDTVRKNQLSGDVLSNVYFAPPYAIAFPSPEDKDTCACCGESGPVIRRWWRKGTARDESVNTAMRPYCPVHCNGTLWRVEPNDSAAPIEEGICSASAMPPAVIENAGEDDRLWAMSVAWDKAKLIGITEHLFRIRDALPQSRLENIVKKYIWGATNCIQKISFLRFYKWNDISLHIRRMLESGMHPSEIALRLYDERVPFEQPQNWCKYRICMLRELKKAYGVKPPKIPIEEDKNILQQRVSALQRLRYDSADEEIAAHFSGLFPDDLETDQGIAVVRVLLEMPQHRTRIQKKFPLAMELRENTRLPEMTKTALFKSDRTAPEWPEILRRVLHYANVTRSAAVRLAFISKRRLRILCMARYASA